MSQPLSETAPSVSYLRCFNGQASYGVALSSVEAIDRPDRMERNSYADGPAGWLPHRDGRVPVYGVSQLLKTQQPRESFGALVRFRTGSQRWALGCARVHRLDSQSGAAQLRALPELLTPQARSLFRGVIAADSGVFLCLDVNHLAPHTSAPHQHTPDEDTPGKLAVSNATSTNTKSLDSTSLKATSPNATAQLTSFVTPFVNPAAIPAHTDARAQVIRFYVDGVEDSFGLSARQIVEYVTSVPALIVPGAQPELPGIVLWRDQPIPVLDLARALGLSTAPTQIERVLIVQLGGSQDLIAIPTAEQMPRLQSPTEFQPCPHHPTIPTELTQGTFQDPAGRLLLPNLTSILHHAAAAWQNIR